MKLIMNFLIKRPLLRPPPIYQPSKIHFHTSRPNKAISPLIWAFLAKPITKLAAILTGRGFRKWWQSLPADKRMNIFKEHLKRNRLKYGSMVGITTTGSLSYYYTHLDLTPITHRKRFILFNSSQLHDIVNIGVEDLKEENKTKIVDANSPHAVKAFRVAKRLFEANKNFNEIANIQWKLTVIDDPVINAAAFPNGEVFVFTGLVDFAKTDDELAVILAHEMSHAILQHAAEELSRKRLVDIFFMSLACLVWAVLPSDLTAFLTQMFVERFRNIMFDFPHSREMEKEADLVGFQLAARACFDIRQSVEFWRRMSQKEDSMKIPEVLSTHPTNESRAIDLERLIPMGLLLRQQCNCHQLPGRN